MDMSATLLINRPPAEVFEYVCEISNDANWRTGVVEAAMTSAGPMGVGSTGFDRAVVRGKSGEAGWRITEFKPGSLARWDLVTGPYKGTGGYICEPKDGGTRFTLEADVKAAGLLALLGPLFAVIGRRQNRNDVEKLKAILES